MLPARVAHGISQLWQHLLVSVPASGYDKSQATLHCSRCCGARPKVAKSNAHGVLAHFVARCENFDSSSRFFQIEIGHKRISFQKSPRH